MTPYTPHARIVEDEQIVGSSREPDADERFALEAYREKYREAFGEWPAGVHYVDTLKKLALFRRAGLS